tara:strand:- start:28214 stop:28762 length:549 start_codon:yes stop_codon:yes gene_type:complete
MSGTRDKGFTLVELMIGLLVLSILIAVAAPSFLQLIKDNRLLSEVYAFRATLSSARSEALAQRTFVIVCRSSDGSACSAGDWNQGYIGFTDVDGSGSPSDPNQIFITHTPPQTLNISYNGAGGDRIRFNSRGFAVGFNGIVTICDDRGDDDASGVVVSPAGIVRSAVVDPNDPGADVLETCP